MCNVVGRRPDAYKAVEGHAWRRCMMTTYASSCLAVWQVPPGLDVDAILQRKHAVKMHYWPYQQFKSLPRSGASLTFQLPWNFGLASLAGDVLLLHSIATGQHTAEAASSKACKAGMKCALVLSM